MSSDRILGLVTVLGALAYIAGATQIRTSFLSDPVGPRAFPIMIGALAALCGLVIFLRPDPEPGWPRARAWLQIAVALAVLVVYALALAPGGFVLPTAIAAGVLSYLIGQHAGRAVFAGLALSFGLFVIFKYALGLGLAALPPGLAG